MRRFALAFAFAAAASPAWAGCGDFKWSVAKEQEALASPQKVASVSASAAVGQAYEVSLTPGLTLPVKPEREPKAGTSAGVLDISKLDAGLYQVTLSEEAWIDVSQDGNPVKSSDFSGNKDCPGVRKSVRFPLKAGPATLEISNAAGPAIKVVVEPAN